MMLPRVLANGNEPKRSDRMSNTNFSNGNAAGQSKDNQLHSSAKTTEGAMKSPLRVATTFLAILLFSVSAWAGDHQICYQIPPVPGWHTIAARFLCRTDGTNVPGCQVSSVVAAAGSP